MTRTSSGVAVGLRLLAAIVAICLLCVAFANVQQACAAEGGNYVSTQQSSVLKVAKAAKKYKIIYKLNGGKQASGQVKKITSGNTLDVSKLKNPKRKNYVFINWYKNKKLTKKATVLQGVSKKSKRTVYAKWVKVRTYKITYKLNGGKLSSSYVKKFKNNKVLKSLPKPVRKGYTFSGWFSDKRLTKPVPYINRGVTKNQTLYAKWDPIEYTVAYSLNGGTLPQDAVSTYSATSPIDNLPIPTRDGFAFMGWYSDRHCTKVVDSIPATSQGNVLLYAKWRKHVLIAHRGLRSAKAPENSIQAFRDAAARGFTEIETDVRFTSDGVPVLVHDETVPLNVGGQQKDVEVSSLTYDELQTADYAWEKAGEDGENFATFESALDVCSKLGVDITIHMKTSDEVQIDTLVQLVRDYGMRDDARWFTSDIAALRYVKEYEPTAHYVYSHTLTKEAAEEAIELASGGADVEVNTYHATNASKVQYFQSKHVPVRTWGYADETQLSKLDAYVASVLVDGLAADFMPDPVVY